MTLDDEEFSAEAADQMNREQLIVLRAEIQGHIVRLRDDASQFAALKRKGQQAEWVQGRIALRKAEARKAPPLASLRSRRFDDFLVNFHAVCKEELEPEDFEDICQIARKRAARRAKWKRDQQQQNGAGG